MTKNWSIDEDYLQDVLLRLLAIHSPTGYTDPIVRTLCAELERLEVDFELTRRGAIRGNLKGKAYSPDRALVAHLDTLGAMVSGLKPNGRLNLFPVGTWSARFAEGARVSAYTDERVFRGTILPLMASGHAYDTQIDTQPGVWSNLELRLDEPVSSAEDLHDLGFRVGEFIGVDSQPEVLPSGFINARHLDDKAGVATVLAMAKAIKEHDLELPVDCHLLFTISEEVGSGASAVLHGDIAEMVTVDNGVIAPGQNSREDHVNIVMADSAGPFDYHLTHHLLGLCERHDIAHARDVFRYYRSDSASALDAGNDIRTALITFGLDASHGYERTHLKGLRRVSEVLVYYALTRLIYSPGKAPIVGTLENFPNVRATQQEWFNPAQKDFIAQIPPNKEDAE